MVNFTLELDRDTPYYLQIYKTIADRINQGAIQSLEKLPSKRKLAKHLNVSTNTVLNAYNLLLDEGYIFSQEKKGYFVSQQQQLTVVPKIASLPPQIKDDYLFDLTTQNTMEKDFSFAGFQKCVRASLAEQSYVFKSPLEGLETLRKAIAEHLLENRGILTNYQQIIIGNGLEMLATLFPLLNASSYALENPGYHKLAKLLENHHLQVEYVDLDENGVQLPKESTVLYTTSFNQFPTGTKMSIRRKKELIQWTTQKNHYLIEDDFDAEFRINDGPTTALYTLNPQKVIFFSSFSSTLFSGARIAYMILPQNVLEDYQTRYNDYSNPVSSLDQTIVFHYLQSGEYAKHINRLKNRYLKKRQMIQELLKDSKNIKIDFKKNYLSMLIHVAPTISMEAVLSSLQEQKIKINTIATYDVKHRESHTIIVGYTNIDEEHLKKALTILKEKIER